MTTIKSYAVGLSITLFFIIIILEDKEKYNDEEENIEVTYPQNYVDSLETEIMLRDSLLGEFYNFIPLGSPLKKTKVNSGYGWRWGRMHQGVDLSGSRRDTVFTTASGVVTKSRRIGGYGKCVIVDHGNGYETLYAHLSKILVEEGETIIDNQPIGKVGSTGFSTGPHLHYEILINGEAINPEELLYKKISKL